MSAYDDAEEELEKPVKPKRAVYDDGLDHRFKKEKKAAVESKKRLKQDAKYALRPDRMFFKDDERNMYAEYFNRFKKDVEERYGSMSTSQEVLIDCLCWAIIRLERKSRLESWFGRFFDRVAPHDPLQQINKTLQMLSLLPEKKEKEAAATSAVSEVNRMLAEDSLRAEEHSGRDLGYEEWLAQQKLGNSPIFEIRTPKELPNYTDADLVFDEEDEEEAT